MIQASPVLGVGLENFGNWTRYYGVDPTVDLHVAHNTYLHIGAEMGVPALAVFLLIVVLTIAGLRKTRRLAEQRGERLVSEAVRSIQAGLVGFSVAAFFLSAQQNRFFWFMVFLSCSLRQMLESRSGRTGSRAAELPKHYRQAKEVSAV
jgi:O-antigen ligase